MQINANSDKAIVYENAHKTQSRLSIDQLWFDVTALLLLPKGYITGIPRTIRKILEEWHANPWTNISYCALHPQLGILEVDDRYIFAKLDMPIPNSKETTTQKNVNQETLTSEQHTDAQKNQKKHAGNLRRLYDHVKIRVKIRNKFKYIPYTIRHGLNRLAKRKNKLNEISTVSNVTDTNIYYPFPEGSITGKVDSPDTKLVLSLGGLWLLNCTADQFESLQADKSLRFASMIYDLIPAYSPHLSSPNDNFLICTNGMLKSSDLIFTISNYSKREIEQYAIENCIDAAKIEVITLGSDIVKNKKTEKDIVRSPFVLTVGSIEVRKNHYGMYMAWRKLVRKLGRENVPILVMAGKPGWQGESIIYLVQNDPLVKGKIMILTSLSDTEIAWLYSTCLFTIYASKYEGWGMPVEESFAYGKMCLTANTTSLPEVGKELADYFDPECDTALADCVLKAIDPAYRLSREANIRHHFRQNTWKKCAAQIRSRLEDHYQFQVHYGLSTIRLNSDLHVRHPLQGIKNAA